MQPAAPMPVLYAGAFAAFMSLPGSTFSFFLWRASSPFPSPFPPPQSPFCPHMLTLTNNAANELPTLSFNPNSSVALGIIERANNGWTANIERRKEGREAGVP